MKTAGLIGGVGWPSTLSYYRLLNGHVQSALGGLHSARCIIVSLDFAPVYSDMAAGNTVGARAQMEAAARQLRAAGVDLVAILANTGHFAADEVQAAAGVPLIHIAREAAAEVRLVSPSLRRLGLLTTSFALDAPFFGRWLGQSGGLTLIKPDQGEQQALDAVIFGPLARGEASTEAAAEVAAMCGVLVQRGAEGILLGCTELSHLLPLLSVSVPLFDSTDIHARAIVREMLHP